MIFDELPIEDAEGAILAYATSAGPLSLRKGTLLTAGHLAVLRAAGVARVLAARFEPGDIGEDDAARRIGAALASPSVEAGPATAGRINLFARHAGLFCVDRASIDAINAHDARISLATLADCRRVEAGQMVATVKIIPFAVPEELAGQACAMAGERRALDVRAFTATRIGLIQSRLPSIRETVLERTRELMERRAARNGGALTAERRVPHEAGALAAALQATGGECDIVVVFGASAVSDEADIVPDAIRRAGGEILRVGMPVDPGNLLVLGRRQGRYIVAAPGSARSARENSLDPVLDRLMAGMALAAGDLARMGVGGLLL